ncbi:MAG: hypothetical protein HY894_10360 [Deltaproteobacteria bacterium]|nr:hypothetical protein [Deltaproteobacteria bacterium]
MSGAKTLIALTAMFACAVLSARCYGAEPGGDKAVETRYATVYAPDRGALISFGRKIGAITFFNREDGKSEELIGERIDEIVGRVRTRLDMYPGGLSFSIRIFPTYVEIQAAYAAFGGVQKPPIAFYSHKVKGIYVSLPDLTDGVLAHEIAHAVICFYFVTPPPGKMQEILAQYVDRHLWDN